MLKKLLKFLFAIFIVFVVIFVTFALYAKHGISINNLNFAGVKVENFYLRVNNNLVLKVDKIKIPNTNNDNSQNVKISDFTKNFGIINRIFESIEIKNLEIGDEKIAIKFTDDTFYLDHKRLYIDSNINPINGGLNIDINQMKFRDFNLSVVGNLRANFDEEIFDFNGSFISHELIGNLEINIKDKILNYAVLDTNAKSLKNFMDELALLTGMMNEVKEWIYGKIVASSYVIEDLRGKIDLKNGEFHTNEIVGNAYARDLNITFDENLNPANVSLAYITLFDGDLHFDLQDPMYKDKNLFGSRVAILDIFDENASLELDLRTDNALDHDLVDILKAYGIEIPIYQTSGKTEAKVLLNVRFIDYDTNVNSLIKLKDAKLNLLGKQITSKNALISIDNDKVTLKDTNFNMGFVDIIGNGAIEFKSSKGVFDIKINEFKIENLVKISNFKDELRLDFSSKDTIISLKKLASKLKLAKNNEINIKNPAIAYSPLLQNIGVKGAQNINITTKDFENFEIVADEVSMDSPLFKDSEPYEKDDVKISVKKDGHINGRTRSGAVEFEINKEKANVNLKNIDIAVDTNSTNSKDKTMDLNFNAQNSNIILKDINKTIYFSNYGGNLRDKSIWFNGKFSDNASVKFSSTNRLFKAAADNVGSKEVNNLIGSQSFDGGNFNLKITGMSTRDFKGEILIKDTYLKDFVLYQRLLSFIDSVPSLLSFKTPDFNQKGFSVKEGKIYFRKAGDNVILEALDFLGTSADIGGRGEINMKSGEINIDIEIKYLKDASNIIGKIPLVNHILLGSDHTISSVIEIRGTLSAPIYRTKVMSDILSTPLNLIKNTITLPFVIFD